MGIQIVWKILSDGNWVMMPKGYEKLSDEWWMMSDEWWKLSDQKNEAKQPLSIQTSNVRGTKISKYFSQFLQLLDNMGWRTTREGIVICS